MSCDDNHEARANDRARRSLPMVGAENVAGAETGLTSRPLWRSIEERSLLGAVPGAANEFPGGASEMDGVSRRGFMQLLGVSTAIATVGAACRKPNEKIIPFVRRPEEITPGNALHFATAYALEGYTSGLLVESHEGRPTKIEGNPAHPETIGATTVTEQALILGLYDDDRAKQLRRGGDAIGWQTFLADVKARGGKLTEKGGSGLRFLTGPTTSPLLADLRRRILERFPQAKFVSYAAVAGDGAVEGSKMAFGRPLVPRHHLAPAAVILSLDSDFLADGPEQTRLSREFSARREPSRDMNRLYVIEPALTITGGMADHRLRLRGSDVGAPLGALAEDIAAGSVDTLVVTGENPVYAAPVDYKLAQLLKRVPNVIYHGLYEDETAAICNYFVPAAHVLESWGDGRATDGIVSISQPLIAPLWGGRTEAEVLAAFVGDGDLGTHELLRRYWRGMAKLPGNPVGSFDNVWERWLADGIVPDTGAGAEAGVAINGQALAQAAAPLLARTGSGMEIAFATDPKVFDGRFANNAWLQELAHPITKLTWDNALLISDATAKGLDLETGDIVEVTYRDRTLEAPAMIVPGHVDDAITLPLGYGRTATGHVGRGVGFNANALRTSEAPWFDRGAALSKTGKRFKFAITQDHWTMSPDGRDSPPPAVSAPLAEVLNPGSMFHEELEERRGPQAVIHQPVDYSGQAYKWGMSVDLNKCTGCNACVVACQSENNIASVGKDGVGRGREMQWIRIDRYFSGPVDEPEMINQPLGCVHCETAPCEYVCPVNATVHSDEGLNEMVYNRCIGTRYCSNNCPYKVRRFNFLDYTGDISAARELGMNPEVTVRSRGVMEKCTYCVQRIERARIATRIEGRPIADGELQTACQQGCPTQAIVFGSLNDPNSKVSQLHADTRRYDLLHELGTRPRTAYLARVRNPNPELAKVD